MARAEMVSDAATQRRRLQALLQQVGAVSRETSVVFITNLAEGPLVDLDENGVVNAAQYYSEAQADQIIRGFRDVGFHVLPFFSETAFMQAVLDGRIERETLPRRVVFTSAEGGTGAGRRALIPAFCRLVGLLCCNSGPQGCAVARHKHHANAILRAAGVRAPEAWLFHGERGWVGGEQPAAGRRVIVKPTYESMAIGVDETSVRTVDTEFGSFVADRARAFGQPASVQTFIAGREIGVPIFELDQVEALPPVEFVLDGAKAFAAAPRTFRQENLEERVSAIPLVVSPIAEAEIRRMAVTAFEALDMSGMGRIDMRLDEEGRPWVFDTNESPPPLPGTSYGASLETLGFTTPDMLALWVGTTLRRGGAL